MAVLLVFLLPLQAWETLTSALLVRWCELLPGIRSSEEKWRLLPAFLKCRGLVKQAIYLFP